MSETISKSELAGLLKLTRARVSQFVAAGLPVRPDGRLNRAEALEWCRKNWRPDSGGWGVNGRATRTARAKTGPKAQRKATAGSGVELPDPAALASDRKWLAEVTGPPALEAAARVAIRLGCTQAQAFGMTSWLTVLPALFSSCHDDALCGLPQPDWTAIFEGLDLEAAEVAFDEAVAPEIEPGR
ncbi:hypothetical protein [uncultured Paludibaculum sp.]|uniref:hypothetical protein n=1 Tax=uncultured Paludibaculum sp. TaxID=1765020 RepID=UPI002AAB2FF6|nr:hypothetical protein [uncultured Paludibaculum sp.]